MRTLLFALLGLQLLACAHGVAPLDKESIAPEASTGLREVSLARSTGQRVSSADPYASRAGI